MTSFPTSPPSGGASASDPRQAPSADAVGGGRGTPAFKDAVWRVLVETCDASSCWHEEFIQHWPACREFRFQGALGFGGKVWCNYRDGRVYVTCYPEDATPERESRIAAANHRLASLCTDPSAVSP